MNSGSVWCTYINRGVKRGARGIRGGNGMEPYLDEPGAATVRLVVLVKLPSLVTLCIYRG